MNGITGTQAAAVALQTSVDAALGYPRPGVNIGGGFHQPGGGATTSAVQPIQNRITALSWAYPVTPETATKLTGPQLASAVPLDATWFPP